MSDFKLGDAVMLKTGGPPMVYASDSEGLLRCFWFGGKSLSFGNFQTHVLKKISSCHAEATALEPSFAPWVNEVKKLIALGHETASQQISVDGRHFDIKFALVD